VNGHWQTEWAAVADRFGVDMEQVRRDHLISHVLAAISAGVPRTDVVFFGGTALSRTYLTVSRLSEDLDLIAVAPRSQVAAALQTTIRTGLARSHGAATWRPALTATTGSQPAVLIVDDQTSVQLQLVEGSGYTWPTEVHDLEQRYADAPPARMTVLTAPGAAAMKLAAWIERRAPRDLYDLWALAERGLITPEAVAVFVTRGPFGQPPGEWVFSAGIDEQDWRAALGHQTRLSIRADQALAVVRRAWLTAAEGTARR